VSDFNFARESVEQLRDFGVMVSEFENDSEQRRLKHASPVVGFNIKSPALTKTQYADYQSHFDSKFGALNTFTFTSPFDDIEYNVRYVAGSFKAVFADGHFICEFQFKVVNHTSE